VADKARVIADKPHEARTGLSPDEYEELSRFTEERLVELRFG
jgi:hypothetical protein